MARYLLALQCHSCSQCLHDHLGHLYVLGTTNYYVVPDDPNKPSIIVGSSHAFWGYRHFLLCWDFCGILKSSVTTKRSVSSDPPEPMSSSSVFYSSLTSRSTSRTPHTPHHPTLCPTHLHCRPLLHIHLQRPNHHPHSLHPIQFLHNNCITNNYDAYKNNDFYSC
jgi:hypothetical protein